MTDSYLAISEIANDPNMTERLNAAVVQQHNLESITLPSIYTTNQYNLTQWVHDYRYSWAASPEWATKWESAKVTHVDDENYEPGRDPAVITDGDILATVQSLGATP